MTEAEVALTPSELPSAAENSYIIRPNFKDKFKPAIVKEAIQELVFLNKYKFIFYNLHSFNYKARYRYFRKSRLIILQFSSFSSKM